MIAMGYGNCCAPGYSGRQFYTKQERRERLEEYAEALEKELKAVKERLDEIKSSK